jgi:hypothetical protein
LWADITTVLAPLGLQSRGGSLKAASWPIFELALAHIALPLQERTRWCLSLKNWVQKLGIMRSIPFVRSAEQPYLRMYTKETVDALVTDKAVAQKFKRYTISYNNGRYERHYVVWVEGRRLAVRGLTHVKFVYLHYFMAEEVACNTCGFKELYYNPSE